MEMIYQSNQNKKYVHQRFQCSSRRFSSKSKSKEFEENITKRSTNLSKKRKTFSNSSEQFDSNSSFDSQEKRISSFYFDEETKKRNSQLKRRFSRRTSNTTTSRSRSRSRSTDESISRDLRPPSSPVDRRCDRIFSSISSNINRETCQLLGPDLCSDCVEIRLKDQFQLDSIPTNQIQENLFQIVRQSRLPSSSIKSSSRHEHQHEQFNQRKSIDTQIDRQTILTDEKYFENLTKNLTKISRQTDFFFRDFDDLTRKYRSNVYPRLRISETPVAKSSNEVFQKIRSDLFDVSTKYSQMKKSSTKTYPFHLNINAPLFISPRKSEKFFSEHRFIQNYSPPLLIQPNQQRNKSTSTSTKQSFSSSTNSFLRPKSSLIASKIHSTF